MDLVVHLLALAHRALVGIPAGDALELWHGGAGGRADLAQRLDRRLADVPVLVVDGRVGQDLYGGRPLLNFSAIVKKVRRRAPAQLS